MSSVSLRKGGRMKFEMLKNGKTVLLRDMTAEDKDQSLHFFRSLSDEDRRYLRKDVTREDIVEGRIRQAVSGEVLRMVAVFEETIVADGSLEFSGDQWRSHMGEIRVIIAPKFRRQRLARIMVRELFEEAQKRHIEKVVVKLLGPQTAVRSACEKMGFRVDAVIPDYAKDQKGQLQSLLVMSCTLDHWWKEMKDAFQESNWPDG